MSLGPPRVLDGGSARDRKEWLGLWRAWPEREPMAHPEYVRLFARQRDRVICLAAGGEEGGVLYPLILRPLASEPWAGPDAREVWDAVSPYGYGGPYAWGEGRSVTRAFWEPFEQWLGVARVVSSFARLSLFDDEILRFPGAVSVSASNVVRRLDLPLDEIWKDYAHKVRKNVSTARRAGLKVEFDAAGSRLEEFLAVYEATMVRRVALSSYHFPREFFETIVRELRGSHVFVHVLSGARVVSTELVLRSARRLYSFLGGTLEEAFDLRPNDLLKHAVAEWGHSEGMVAYVLGGGYRGSDGIFRYKLAFAPKGEVPFRVGKAIHDASSYEELVRARRAYEASRGSEWSPRAGFFPEYRA